jgi:hypothetical protein
VNIGKAAPEQTGHVFSDDPDGAELGDDVGHGRPQPPLVLLRAFETRIADRLAGETSGHNVNSGSGLGSPPVDTGSDIVMLRHSRPVFGEHGTAELVELDLTDNPHPGPLKPQADPSDTREHFEHVQGVRGRLGQGKQRARLLPPLREHLVQRCCHAARLPPVLGSRTRPPPRSARGFVYLRTSRRCATTHASHGTCRFRI